jgi:hypothetical protein
MPGGSKKGGGLKVKKALYKKGKKSAPTKMYKAATKKYSATKKHKKKK